MSSQIDSLITREYAAGFVTDIEQDTIPPGLDEGVVREISRRKNEPAFMLEWRLKAYRRWLTMKEPHWPNVHYDPIDYQAVSYFEICPWQVPRRHPGVPLTEAGRPARP